MLKNTFCFLKGISQKKEALLWKNKIYTWSDYANVYDRQISFFNNKSNIFEDAYNAYNTKDVDFFIKKIPHDIWYRVAYSFPQDVIFLDIETTGLSFIYDEITVIGWMKNGKYDCYINGESTEKLFTEIESSKAIITFNGSLFDIKFISVAFPELKIPECHIDLRFFARRLGLSGGQKKIETELGFRRTSDIAQIHGENAPILWYKYCRGDMQSISTLIDYNFYDIQGMAYIFDECVNRMHKINNIPDIVNPTHKFYSSTIQKEHKTIFSYAGDISPKMTYDDLNKMISLKNFCVIGLDLVASEKKGTGVAVLKGNNVHTSKLFTDDEILNIILSSKAKLVSIDSPLSIPKGRTSYWDDDPQRYLGITRECERILKKRGISSYPCLINSMQKLTKRGIELAEKIRKLGIPVIESYPGAAQDIMNIPRKQQGLCYLKNGLHEFGIQGDYLVNEVSHDELDAITSAIVGIFFWCGKFEALGNEDEDYLIIPNVSVNNHKWISRKCIVLSGTIGSGKTTTANILRKKGFAYSRFSAIIEDLLKCKRQDVTRQTLQSLGQEIHESGQQRWLARQVASKVIASPNSVIDGLRFPEDLAFLREVFGPAITHWHITNEEARKTRFDKMNTQAYEMALHHKVESAIPALAVLCDLQIRNEGSLRDLQNNIEALLGM